MFKNFKLNIKDFALIKNANIELKKLNVIAGVNGSGKSTSSKLLYCFLVSNSKYGDYLANESIYERFKNLIVDINLNSDYEINNSNFLDNLPSLFDSNFLIEIKENIKKLKTFDINNQYVEKIKNIENVINFNQNINHKFFNVSNVLLNSEFNFKGFNFNKTHVSLSGNYDNCNFYCNLILNNKDIGLIIEDGKFNCLNIENTIYIDSPLIFDVNYKNNQIFLKNSPIHLKFLSKLLDSNEHNNDVYDREFNQKLDMFHKKFNDLIGGYIYFDENDNEYKFKKGNKDFSMKDTASGVKQLGLIQFLLRNRMLNKNSFLIIDEPEVNIHPEWQVKFAEILVLMIKELNIYTYINSHSPQFIEALEVYSAKYGLIEDSKFYLTNEDEDLFNFEEIPREHLAKLYNNLGDPYDEINKVRADNMINGIF